MKIANFFDFHPTFQLFFPRKMNEIVAYFLEYFPKKNNRRATFIREIRVDPYEIPLIFKFERIFGNIYYVTRTLLFCTLFDVTCFWNDKEPFIFSGLLFFWPFLTCCCQLNLYIYWFFAGAATLSPWTWHRTKTKVWFCKLVIVWSFYLWPL